MAAGLIMRLKMMITSSNLIYKRKDLKFSIAGNYPLLIDGELSI